MGKLSESSFNEAGTTPHWTAYVATSLHTLNVFGIERLSPADLSDKVRALSSGAEINSGLLQALFDVHPAYYAYWAYVAYNLPHEASYPWLIDDDEKCERSFGLLGSSSALAVGLAAGC